MDRSTKTKLLASLRKRFQTDTKITIAGTAKLAVEVWREVLPEMELDEPLLKNEVKMELGNFFEEHDGPVAPTTITLLILKAMVTTFKKMSAEPAVKLPKQPKYRDVPGQPRLEKRPKLERASVKMKPDIQNITRLTPDLVQHYMTVPALRRLIRANKSYICKIKEKDPMGCMAAWRLNRAELLETINRHPKFYTPTAYTNFISLSTDLGCPVWYRTGACARVGRSG